LERLTSFEYLFIYVMMTLDTRAVSLLIASNKGLHARVDLMYRYN